MKPRQWRDAILYWFITLANRLNMATKRSKTAKGFNQFTQGNGKSKNGLTPQAYQLLAKIALELGSSAAVVLEELAKGKIALATEKPEKTVMLKPDGEATEETSVRIEVVEQSPWQQALAEKDEKIAKLEKELAQQQEIAESYQAGSLQSQQQSIYIGELEEARSRQRQEIGKLNLRVSELQNETEQKNQQIQNLQAQLSRLQGLASIAEQQLNRWRSRNIR